MTDTPKITPADAGCWLNGSQGWRNSARVALRANDYGFYLSDNDRAVIDFYMDGDVDGSITLSDGETVDYNTATEWINGQGEMSDSATSWLQHLAPDGYVFVWDAGELDLMAEGEATDYGYLG